MTEHKIAYENRPVYYRLVAFWVVCEAFAGGIMHGINLPFTGMIVSSLAVISIILIAWHIPYGSSIIKATIIVAIFKLMLSPHSPPTAYIAVFFQGMMGQLLFVKRRFFVLSSIVLSILALVESSIQRILVLIILYGNDFWKAVNVFIKKLIGDDHISNYSLLLAILYISLHAIAGFFVGLYGSRLAKKTSTWGDGSPGFMIEKNSEPIGLHRKRKGILKIKKVFLLIWIILATLFIQSLIQPGRSLLPSSIAIKIILRSILVVMSWYFLVSPGIMYLIRKTLKAQQKNHEHQLNIVIQLLPETKHIFMRSWQLSNRETGISRIRLFLKIVLMNILSEPRNVTSQNTKLL